MTSSSWQIIALVLAFGIGAFWWTGARAREHAIRHARAACAQHKFQFLDQSVALDGLAVMRLATGSIGLCRRFTFEFTAAGDVRDRATVTMHGPKLQRVELPWITDEEGNRVYLQ